MPRLLNNVKRRGIARVLRGVCEGALQPPGQRVKPEDAAVDGGRQGDERVATRGMSLFVRQDSLTRGGRPIAPCSWHDDARANHANRDRRGEPRGLIHVAADREGGTHDGPHTVQPQQ